MSYYLDLSWLMVVGSFQILDDHQRHSLVFSIARVVRIGLVRASAHKNDGVASVLMRDFGGGRIFLVAIVGAREGLRHTSQREVLFAAGGNSAENFVFTTGNPVFPEVNAVNGSRCPDLADDNLITVVFREF